MKVEEDNELSNASYKLTPKGIFAMALLDSQLVESVDDHQLEVAWELFELRMKRLGYVKE